MADAPKRIWAWSISDRGFGRWTTPKPWRGSTEYTRTDIADELAKALEVIVKRGDEGMDGEYFKAEMTEKARAALAKYKT